jgi:hypothetical protein
MGGEHHQHTDSKGRLRKEPPPPLSRLYMGVVLTFTNMHSLVMSTLTSISSTPTRRVSFNSQTGPTYTVPEHLSYKFPEKNLKNQQFCFQDVHFVY